MNSKKLAPVVVWNGRGSNIGGDVPPVGHTQTDRVRLTLRGSWPGYRGGLARAVAIQGNYAYVVDGDIGLRVLGLQVKS